MAQISLQTYFGGNGSVVQSKAGVLVELPANGVAVSPSPINSTSTVFTAAVNSGTASAYIEPVANFLASK